LSYRKIGELVNQNIHLIIDYCNKKAPNELNNLLDLNYSHRVFGLHYPFFIELANISDKDSKRAGKRFYKKIFNVCNKKIKLTSQWFDYNKEKFENYIKKIKNVLNKNIITAES
jgi:hypothetical protein